MLVTFLSYCQCPLPYRNFAILWGHICRFLIVQHRPLLFCLGIFPCAHIFEAFPSFSSISFSVSCLMWRSLIHLDLSFVQGYKNGSICILLHDNCQLSQHHLLKMLSFFHWMVLAPLSKFKWPQVFISGTSVLFHWSNGLSLYQYHAVFITIAL